MIRVGLIILAIALPAFAKGPAKVRVSEHVVRDYLHVPGAFQHLSSTVAHDAEAKKIVDSVARAYESAKTEADREKVLARSMGKLTEVMPISKIFEPIAESNWRESPAQRWLSEQKAEGNAAERVRSALKSVGSFNENVRNMPDMNDTYVSFRSEPSKPSAMEATADIGHAFGKFTPDVASALKSFVDGPLKKASEAGIPEKQADGSEKMVPLSAEGRQAAGDFVNGLMMEHFLGNISADQLKQEIKAFGDQLKEEGAEIAVKAKGGIAQLEAKALRDLALSKLSKADQEKLKNADLLTILNRVKETAANPAEATRELALEFAKKKGALVYDLIQKAIPKGEQKEFVVRCMDSASKWALLTAGGLAGTALTAAGVVGYHMLPSKGKGVVKLDKDLEDAISRSVAAGDAHAGVAMESGSGHKPNLQINTRPTKK